MISKLITVGILNLNGYERLTKVIPSILKQDYENYEIIVADNGSTDGSLEYLKKYTQIRIISNKINNYGYGKNLIVKNSNGHYVLLLDNDIELPDSHYLSDIEKVYSSLSNAGFLSTILKDYNSTIITSVGLFFNKLQKPVQFNDIIGKGVVRRPGFSGNHVFFERDIFLNLGGYDEIYPFNIDDYDLSARANLNGYINYVSQDLYVIHHGVETRINKHSLAWKDKYYFSGFCRMMIKNYNARNLAKFFIPSVAMIFYKYYKHCRISKSVLPLCSLFTSMVMFVRDLKSTIIERKKIQMKRTVKQDMYL